MAPTLAIDIGGTKILAALVQDKDVLASQTIPTLRNGRPEDWIAQAYQLAANWHGQYEQCGVTVTGAVHGGLWSAMNPKTLNVPDRYPLSERITSVFGMVPTLRNDAQAAAWGEYCYGAGARKDCVFLTISTGIGGGVVANGRLLQGQSGVSGHFGLTLDHHNNVLEDMASGNWIAAEANRLGHELQAPDIFMAADNGAEWAHQIIDESANHIARLCHNLQLSFDPSTIVIGGGVGLAPGYLSRVQSKQSELPVRISSTLTRAALGANAGVLGIAALAHLEVTKGD